MYNRGMTIRKPNQADRETLAELFKQFDHFNKNGGGVTPAIADFEADTDADKWPLKYADEIIEGKKYFGFVAEEGDLVGFIVGSIKEREGYVMDKEGYVEDFFVVDD